MINISYKLCFLHASAVLGEAAECREMYADTLSEYRKALTTQCAASECRVGGSADKQAVTMQGGRR